MLRLVLASHIAAQYKEKSTIYLPDFLIYDFDNEEYQNFWQELAAHPKARLYTDGLYVTPVGWIRFAFESFKGWLGFENHCHPNRVEMTLAKIAYTGYLKGFQSTELQKSDAPLISMRFSALVNAPRTNQNSKEIQQLLMSYFITHSHAFPELNQSIYENYPFGQTFIREYLAYLVPSIDPQDSQIIERAIQQINYRQQLVSKSSRFKASPFAEAYAQSLTEQQKYAEALEWSLEVKKKFKEAFIEFYLTQEEYDDQALNNAVELIVALSASTIIEDQNKAVAYMKVNFNYEEQTVYLKPYTDLRNKVAKAYLDDAKKEKNKWSITKLFTGNQTIEFLAQAVRLDPKVLDQDDSMQDIMIREEWTLYQFNTAIDANRFQDADALHENHLELKFNKNKLNLLREYYLSQLSSKEAQIKQALWSRNTQTAEQMAAEQLALAKKIVRINPQEHLVMTATINYASTLLEIDAMNHPVPKNADLVQLDKAQNILSEYSFLNSNPSLVHVLNKILQRKIDCHIAKLGVPIDYQDSLETRTTFVKEHQKEIDALKIDLKTFISLNEQKTKEMRQTLAKIYYLLADTLVFFEEKKQESIFYFKKAKELMPENPYYNLRYLELIEDEKRHEVRNQIDEIGFLHSTKYQQYMLERWNEEIIMSNGFDIHAVLPDNSGFLNALGRVVGFS